MAIHPYLRQVLTQGTAEQVGEGPLKNSTFVAQAECELCFGFSVTRLLYRVSKNKNMDSQAPCYGNANRRGVHWSSSFQVKARALNSSSPPAPTAATSPLLTASPASTCRVFSVPQTSTQSHACCTLMSLILWAAGRSNQQQRSPCPSSACRQSRTTSRVRPPPPYRSTPRPSRCPPPGGRRARDRSARRKRKRGRKKKGTDTAYPLGSLSRRAGLLRSNSR